MTQLGKVLVREPGAGTPRTFRRLVYVLALVYVALFGGSIAGIVLIAWRGKMLVTLSQRSNVETLTLAFFLVFFGYIATVSAPGLWGAFRIGWMRLAGMGNVARREGLKQRALGDRSPDDLLVAVNCVVELEGKPLQAFAIPVGDEHGDLGVITINGAKVAHCGARRRGSNHLISYLVEQVNDVLRARGVATRVQVVAWASVEDEAVEIFVSNVEFARNLQRTLKSEALWPQVELRADDVRELERRLTEVAPAVRDEAFLPDWEFQAEHKLPIIPEPLGLIMLSRSERRADPLATMGCAAIVVGAIVAGLALIIAFPPWVPGR